MSTAIRLSNFLNLSQTPYNVVHHKHTECAADSAQAAHIPSARVVKSVLLRDKHEDRYLMALTPACNRIELGWVRDGTGTDPVLAHESELADVFPDCEVGAVPGFGQAYHLDIIWDEDLGKQPSLFFEAGDHEDLIEIEQHDFHRLFDGFPHATISQVSEAYLFYRTHDFEGYYGA